MYVHKGAWQIMVMLYKSAIRMGSLLIIIYIRNAQFKDSYMNIKLWMVYGVRELRNRQMIYINNLSHSDHVI